jgi:hypothetical protein
VSTRATVREHLIDGDWREVKRDLLTLDFEAAWNVSNVSEQRALIAGVFSRIVAGPEVVTFHIHGQPFPIQAEWSAVVKVAGPGLEPGTPGFPSEPRGDKARSATAVKCALQWSGRPESGCPEQTGALLVKSDAGSLHATDLLQSDNFSLERKSEGERAPSIGKSHNHSHLIVEGEFRVSQQIDAR